jgi:hypothetical protein
MYVRMLGPTGLSMLHRRERNPPRLALRNLIVLRTLPGQLNR